MLSVFRGHSVRYLTDEVAKAREGYYTGAVAAGEPPGLWWGKGAETLGLAGEVDADLMEAVYTHLVDPRDPASLSPATWGEAAMLGTGHRKYQTAEQIYAQLLAANSGASPDERAQLRTQAGRKARQAVAFIDMTFSAPKSVTVAGLSFERAASEARACGDLVAAAAWDVHAKAIEDAMYAGARAALAYMQEHAGYSRIGHHGGGANRFIDAHEFVVAQFLQHDSRERDPQWHIHNAILNRVLCADGKWRSLDGRAIEEHLAAAGALGERVMEAHLAQSIGARSETRPDGKAREVVGVDAELMDLYSSRRHQIGPKADELIRGFTETIGREPSAYERAVIYEQATLATRKAKSHDGETREQQYQRWELMARERVAGGLVPVAERLGERAQNPGEPAEFSPLDVIERAVASLEDKRQHYNRSDMFRSVSDALPGHLGIRPEDVLLLIDGLTDAALERVQQLGPPTDDPTLPDELRLANGESAYRRHGSTRYSTPGQLAAERSLIAAAVERGAATLPESAVDDVIARFAESGTPLGADQEAALRGVLTSGAQIEVLSAAAGTGKSFVVGAIAGSWTADAGPDTSARRVFGLAPYQNAAEVLASEGLPTKNVAAWLATQVRLDRARPGTAASGPNGDDEQWRLRSGDLVVVDEAGTAETGHLVEILRRCARVGAKLLLVGDTKQLTTIGPGGALADIEQRGITYQLTEVRRFRNDWEGLASLRLRDGDADVLAEYSKRGRLVDGGTAEQAEALASRAWLADTLTGRESLLMVDSNASAARVSAALRAELIRLGRVEEDGVPLGVGGDMTDWRGVHAGVGDLVQARALAWHLCGFEGNAAAPITRKTYRVLGKRADGGLTVAPIVERRQAGEAERGEWNVWGERLGVPMELPGSYVREHVSLGYASTKDAAQGRNVDTGHSLAKPGTTAAGLYVPATRGRDCNTIYAVTRHLAPDAETGETFETASRTPEAVLADVLDNVREDRSATAEHAAAEQVARSVMTTVDQMVDLIRDVTAGRAAATLDRLATTGELTIEQRQQLAADDAFGSLERLLRTAELAGHDPDQILVDAITVRSLDDANSPAQVLHHRISRAHARQLTPHIRNGSMVDLIPADVGAGEQAQKRREWLTGLAEAADTRRHELGAETAIEAPAWAVDALGPVPDPGEVVARQDWEHRAGWAAAYRELVGHTDEHDALGGAPGRGRVEHATIFRAAHEALALVDAGEEEAGLSDGRLRARVVAWERERNWAPRWVDDELAATHERRNKLTADAIVWAARADAPDIASNEAAQLRADAAAARAEVEQLSIQVEQLDYASQIYGAWVVHTAKTRDLAERSEFELRARGVDVHAPDDRVKASEWLTAQREDEAAAERDQLVREEYELAVARPLVDAERSGRPEISRSEPAAVEDDVAQAAVEPAPDIRETAVRDAGEDADPADRRRVRPVDETVQAVARAQEALAEIGARQAVDAKHAAEEAADREITEQVRRDSLSSRASEAGAESGEGVDLTSDDDLVRDR